MRRFAPEANYRIMVKKSLVVKPERPLSVNEAINFVWQAYETGAISFPGGTFGNKLYQLLVTTQGRAKMNQQGKGRPIKEDTANELMNRLVPGWFTYVPSHFLHIASGDKVNEYTVLYAVWMHYKSGGIYFGPNPTKDREYRKLQAAYSRARLAKNHNGTGMPDAKNVYELAQRNMPDVYRYVDAAFIFNGDISPVEVK